MNEDSLDALLRATLFRRDCPDAMTLSDYQGNALSQSRQTELKVHIEQCHHCQAELGQLIEMLGDQLAAANHNEITVPTAIPASLAHELWEVATGYAWKRINETGEVLIRLLDDRFAELGTPVADALTDSLIDSPIALKSSDAGMDESTVVRYISVDPNAVGGADVEVVVEEVSSDQAHYHVTVRAQIPDRWLDMGGILVSVSADTWTADGYTDDNGEVCFTGLPKESLALLEVSIGLDP